MIIKAVIIFKQQILTLSNTKFQKLDHIWSLKTPDLNQRLYLIWFPIHHLTLWLIQYITCKFHPSNIEWNLFFQKCCFSSYHASYLNYLLKRAEKTLRSDKIKNAIKILSKAKQVRSMLVVLLLPASKGFDFFLLW